MTMEEASRRFAEVMDVLRANTDPNAFRVWFQDMELARLQEKTLILLVKEKFILGLLKSRYMSTIVQAVRLKFGEDYNVDLVDEEGLKRYTPPSSLAFNPKYTFDSFVVGPSNRFANAAALAVATEPAQAYNPLFLYGGVGLGKTHLMHAIGQYIIQHFPEKKVCYITSESFVNQLVEGIARKNTSALRDNVRNVDVLMIDDIQFIAGKDSTQQEVFHTFNELHGNGKQIILSSDRPPKEIPTLEERLRSRFEMGLIADIQKPDLETRMAILSAKVESDGLVVDNNILYYIAEKIDTNIRDLEGALTRVTAMSELSGEKLTLEMAQESLSRVLDMAGSKKATPDSIRLAVAEYYSVSVEDLLSARRNKEIALPRQVGMYLTREMTSLSTTRIGDFYGGRDHTTVLHACRAVADSSKKDKELRDALEAIRSASVK